MAQWHPVVYCSGLHEQPTCCVQYSKCLLLQELGLHMYWRDHETLKNKVKNLLTWVQVHLIFILFLFVFIHFYIFQIG